MERGGDFRPCQGPRVHRSERWARAFQGGRTEGPEAGRCGGGELRACALEPVPLTQPLEAPRENPCELKTHPRAENLEGRGREQN